MSSTMMLHNTKAETGLDYLPQYQHNYIPHSCHHFRQHISYLYIVSHLCFIWNNIPEAALIQTLIQKLNSTSNIPLFHAHMAQSYKKEEDKPWQTLTDRLTTSHNTDQGHEDRKHNPHYNMKPLQLHGKRGSDNKNQMQRELPYTGDTGRLAEGAQTHSLKVH